MQGKIKRLISDKNFGFISSDEMSKDLFFHQSDVVDGSFQDLQEGMTVEFEMGESPKGPKATNVRVV